MDDRESLWYLIDGLLCSTYDVKTFCKEFTRIYDLEVDYDTLGINENEAFKELCGLTARFSDDVMELSIPNMYVSEAQIRKYAHQIATRIMKT